MEMFSVVDEQSFIVWLLKQKQSNQFLDKSKKATHTP